MDCVSVCAPDTVWLHTATLQVYRVGFNLVKPGNPVAGSFQPATCINTPRCWQAWWLYGCSFTSLGCGTDMFFIAVSMLFAQIFFLLWGLKGCSRKSAAEFQMTRIAISDRGVNAYMLRTRERGNEDLRFCSLIRACWVILHKSDKNIPIQVLAIHFLKPCGDARTICNSTGCPQQSVDPVGAQCLS